MTGSVAGIRRRRTVAGRRETPHLPPDRDFYGQTLTRHRFKARHFLFPRRSGGPQSVGAGEKSLVSLNQGQN